MTDTRLDRIEKNLEVFIRGLSELKNAQLKTDEQIAGLRASQEETDKQIRAAQLKTDEQIAGLRASQEETDKQIRAAQLKTDEQISELRASQEETNKQIRETDEQITKLKASQKKTDAQVRKTSKKIDEVGRQLGDMGITQGQIAEDLFCRNVRSLFHGRHPGFRRVRLNLKKKGIAEYDIVAAGSGEVLVIEVKNKLSSRMVDTFVDKKLPMFREVFPEYRDCRLLGGVGGLVVKDDVGRHAQKAGLYVLTQNSEGGASLFNSDDFKPRVF